MWKDWFRSVLPCWGVVLFLFNLQVIQAQSSSVELIGRCPNSGLLNSSSCTGQIDQCQTHAQCGQESLCCSTGCHRVCMQPSFTACDHAQQFYGKQARLLTLDESKTVHVPKCTSLGDFEEIQCHPLTGNCWCVDAFGFEKGGTRAKSHDEVNCSRVNPKCAGPQCRMLCPYGFELNDDGCEICSCKDICSGVKCPGSFECQLQEVTCAKFPCPPMPTCKKARTLDSLCPLGLPFSIPETGNPFLCGVTPGKPSCPTGFNCHVNTGDDYGVCCGMESFYEKPGLCPVVTSASANCDESLTSSCQSSCQHDLECPEMKKCCMTESRGKQCTQAINSTLCLQQKKIAEILSAREIEGKGYIPQCDMNGHFLMKQCSRNRKICWCVDSEGRNIPQTLSLEELVNCTNSAMLLQPPRRRDLNDEVKEKCDINLCTNTCEFGYNTDESTGCGTCNCNDDPCDSIKCLPGTKCSYIKSPECASFRAGSGACPIRPTCLPNVLHVNPCDNGTPLVDHSTNQLVVCSETQATCPNSYLCVKASVNANGLCCLNRPRLEPTKPGMCPFISGSLCNGTLETSSSKQCSLDGDCEGDMKCCALPCGAVCADPLLDGESHRPQEVDNKLPTMCQYFQSLDYRQNDVLKNFKLAITPPTCKASGEFEELQCTKDGFCYCIDEFGMEIESTRVSKSESKLTQEVCLEKRRMTTCLDMTCRLGCDYGYKIKNNCRICECVNPCDSTTLCDENHSCEIVDMDCAEGYCPAVPYCIPKIYALMTIMAANGRSFCPKGNPYIEKSTKEVVTCRPRARMLQCPDDYFCSEVDASHDFGYCCPIAELLEDSPAPSSGNHGNIASLNTGANGLDDNSNHRKSELTECEATRERHLEMILDDHKIRYVPRCNPMTGDWEPVQCIEEVNMCWCVTSRGVKVAGSITSGNPTCNFRQSRGKFLGHPTALIDQAVCPEGEHVHYCQKILCEHRSCKAFPDAICRIDPCGGCTPRFYDQITNKAVNCEAGLEKCHLQTQQIINSGVWINQQRQTRTSNSDVPDEITLGSLDHIIEDVLRGRIKRSVVLPSVGELVADVMRQNLEQFGEKFSEIFLPNNMSPTRGSKGIPEVSQPYLSDQHSQYQSLLSPPIHPHQELWNSQNPQTPQVGIPLVIEKASCPQPSANEILFRLSGQCSDFCNYDDECTGHDERCCLIDCQYRCYKVAVQFQIIIDPKEVEAEERLPPATMILLPPHCRDNGKFQSTQLQGDLMWCVNPDGIPQNHTFTRGYISCSPEGNVVTKRSTGRICSTDVEPVICTNECFNAACPAHPDAICVADPCDQCSVSFFSPTGERVRCQDRCHQKADEGLCRASFSRYFFNSSSAICEEFLWGGCQGNDNNFETLDECKRNCQREAEDLCSMSATTGNCESETQRWYFDSQTDSCHEFTACNVQGANNFETKSYCQSKCPARVLCPNVIDGSLLICNRNDACRNLTKACPGLRNTSYICDVEPCSCTATMMDGNGNVLKCDMNSGETVSESSELIKKTTVHPDQDKPLSRMLDDETEDLVLEDNILQASSTHQILILKPGFESTATRCETMREKYFSKCDDDGNFVATQCSPDEPVCWCVDSVGNQVEGTTTFLAGSLTCPAVILERVSIRLTFPISPADDISRSQLATEMQDTLQRLGASVNDGKVSVEVSRADAAVNVDFVLQGKLAGLISHKLEEGMRLNLLGISVHNRFVPAELSKSQFHYVVSKISTVQSDLDDETTTLNKMVFDEAERRESGETNNLQEELNISPTPNGRRDTLDDGVTSKEVQGADGDYSIVAIVLSVAAAITALLIIIGFILGLQNKKVNSNKNNYPKHKFDTLPFSSPFLLEKTGSESNQSSLSSYSKA